MLGNHKKSLIACAFSTRQPQASDTKKRGQLNPNERQGWNNLIHYPRIPLVSAGEESDLLVRHAQWESRHNYFWGVLSRPNLRLAIMSSISLLPRSSHPNHSFLCIRHRLTNYYGHYERKRTRFGYNHHIHVGLTLLGITPRTISITNPPPSLVTTLSASPVIRTKIMEERRTAAPCSHADRYTQEAFKTQTGSLWGLHCDIDARNNIASRSSTTQCSCM